ncbi:hypothetical protein VSH64_11230 [Amycolatopsis rhabdoformis]|uniref:Uncharacterized protein n=1 Tax=Amycolatopsis rhabdoformis TaxID=1448059 RepID=A0ABZ1IDZ9_9PSEU|nr:hypothetical protein [Amycolatopsis rhabdoformis]WSE32675.1 hypothetical protein VSH64_11230 [Amycolatopsis rhabdoformis]
MAAHGAAHRAPRSADRARQILGFGDAAEPTRAAEAEANSPYASVKDQPEYAREQDVRDEYFKQADPA